jgi:hypothetical protein
MVENRNLEQELNDLKSEVDNFQKEKDRVRAILGKMGGVPTFHTRLINTIFVTALVFSVVFSIFAGEKWRLIMIELTTVLLSIKIIYLIHCMMKMNHFKFWMLSSIEWRLNEISKSVKRKEKISA